MIKHITADTSLSSAEKEDKEALSLLRPKQRPSRKTPEKRAPRRQQRKGRVKVDDPDLKIDRSDLSLGKRFNKNSSSKLRFSVTFLGIPESLKPYYNDRYKEIKKASPALADQFVQYVSEKFLKIQEPKASDSTPSGEVKTSSDVNIYDLYRYAVDAPPLSEEQIEELAKAMSGGSGSGSSSPAAAPSPEAESIPELTDEEYEHLGKLIKSLEKQILKLIPRDKSLYDRNGFRLADLKQVVENLYLSKKLGLLTSRSKKDDNIRFYPIKKEELDSLKSVYQAVSAVRPKPAKKSSEKPEPGKTDSDKPRSDKSSLQKYLEDQKKAYDKAVATRIYDAEDVYTTVKTVWEPDVQVIPFGARAGIIIALERYYTKLSKEYKLPEELKSLTSIRSESRSEDTSTFAQKMLNDYDFKSFSKEVANQWLDWAVAVNLHAYLRSHAKWPGSSFKQRQDAFIKSVYKVYAEAKAFDEVYEAYHKVISKKLKPDYEEIRSKSQKDFVSGDAESIDKLINSMEKFLDNDSVKSGEVLDPEALARELIAPLEETFKGSPKLVELKKKMNLSSSSSYRPEGYMMNKTSSYHGVKDQWNPHGDSTGWTYLDKRYLNKEHYDSIIASAKDFLTSGWLSHNWEKSAVDAQHRAALDLAIATADGSAYQSKIDSSTYNMLLNRLSSLNHELFVDTFIPTKATKPEKKREASMSNPVENLLKVASEIQESHPELSLEIIKNLRAINASRVASDDSSVSVDVNTLVRVAFENPETRSTLLPIIAAKKKSSKKKMPSKKASPKVEADNGKEGKPSKKATKGKAKGKGRKASVEIDGSDLSW